MTSAQAAPAAGGTHAYPLQRHFIDGAFRESQSRRTFLSLDPATNEPLAAAAEGDAFDVDARGRRRAPRVRRRTDWPRMKATERAAVLRRIGALIRERADEFIEREVRDIGMPVAQMRGLAARAATNFDYYAGVVTELHGRSFQVGEEFLNYTIRKPVGVAGMIMPWNAPLMLSTWRIAPALAAGNTVVLKPAEWSPLTATLLAEVLADAGVPAGVFNVVHGFGETAGARALLARGRGPDLLHGRDEHRLDDHRRGRADAEALVGRARRQVPRVGLRGRRPGAGGRRGARADLHHERPALHRGLAPAGAQLALRGGRLGDRRARARGSGSATRATRRPSWGP